ncbi:hypothetical protein L596_003142 [Steinernema carpocapsae]|uniref:Metaxin glutathione S-transferase domain-containing protein n=1 Tax=Steinernema carpocapsae TaxID=34508 RepID=A0A4U8URJ5_STECR|nr:hypothetical protein L596_003142 [Steinernema carpocapsae]
MLFTGLLVRFKLPFCGLKEERISLFVNITFRSPTENGIFDGRADEGVRRASNLGQSGRRRRSRVSALRAIPVVYQRAKKHSVQEGLQKWGRVHVPVPAQQRGSESLSVLSDIPYENVETPLNVRSREGTLPFVEYNGVEYPDSGFAIRNLTTLLHKEALESHLNDEQRSVSRAFENLIETSLFMSYNQTGRIPHISETFALLPPSFSVLGPFVSWFAQRAFVSKMLLVSKSYGIGKHSEEDVVEIGRDDLKAISEFLGSKHYFTGFKPTRIDAALFGMLAQIVYMPFDTPHKQFLFQKCQNLVEFCERVKGRYWPDWEDCTKKFMLNTERKKKSVT